MWVMSQQTKLAKSLRYAVVMHWQGMVFKDSLLNSIYTQSYADPG